MKNFEVFGTNYTVESCTAVAYCDLAENLRQDALLVTSLSDGEKFEYVVFDCQMPETLDDFMEMCEDSTAWESEYDVLETVATEVRV